jgi:hypothetical protein
MKSCLDKVGQCLVIRSSVFFKDVSAVATEECGACLVQYNI